MNHFEAPSKLRLIVTQAPFRRRSHRVRVWSVRKTMLVPAALGILFAAERVDRVAAALTLVAFFCTVAVLKIRSHRAARGAGVVLGVSAMFIGLLAAFALPVYAERRAPLIVNVPSEAEPASSAPSTTPLTQITAHDGVNLLGFAATDYDETASDLDATARYLSVVAATGITLGDSPGTIVVAGIEDSVLRAHIAGARAYGVVTNYDGTDFNPNLVRALFDSNLATDRFVSAVKTEVAKDNLDGIVLDFESLKGNDRTKYPALVASLHRAMAGKALLVAAPGSTDQLDVYSRAYDLGALARNSDSLILMAYDEHDPSGAAGSIASLPWVRDVVAEARRAVPANKLMLGVPSFGYVWKGSSATAPTTATDITAIEGSALVGQDGRTLPYDTQLGERHGTLADGREAWFVDAEGARARTTIATEYGLNGVAMWRIGSEEAGTFQSLPITPKKETPVPPGRPIVEGQHAGVIALTFDDGPDPTWTPKILAILKDKQVPGTFFVVAKQAEKHQGLITQIMDADGVVANHTFSHLNTANASAWRTKLDIEAGRAVVEGITGKSPLLFRAPYGAGDTTNGHKGADAIATELGMRPIGWNVDSNDWRRLGASTIERTVVDGVSGRSIVLLHDGGGDRSQTVAALPHIIDRLRAEGYVFTTVDGIDASISNSYAIRTSNWSRVRGLTIVAVFRLQLAVRKLFLWIVIATAVAAFLRVLFAGPLAVTHVLHRKGRLKELAAMTARPSVTVLVPAFNEAPVIEKTLLALVACSPRPDRIIVLDDGSTDDTTDVVRRMMTRIREHVTTRDFIHLEMLPNGGKAKALNVGTRLADTDVVLVIDADTAVDPSIIEHLALHFRDPRVGAVAGNVKVGNRRNFFAALQTLEYIIALNLDRRAQDTARVMAVVPGAAGAFRRSALVDAGGYPSDTLVEDADLTQALLRDGWRIPYEPAAIAWTEAPQSLNDVIKQRRRWSFGTIQVVNKHKHAILEPKAGVLGLVGLPWMLLTQVALPVLGPIADVYLVYLVLIGARSQAIGILGLAFVADIALSIVAVAVDRESPSMVLLAPLLRLIWRPLQLWIVACSALRFARGEDESWRQITRHNSVKTVNGLPDHALAA